MSLQTHSREEVKEAIEKWLELNNFITIIDWESVSNEEVETKLTYSRDNEHISVSICDFYAVGFGSVTEHRLHDLFREIISLEIYKESAEYFLKEFKMKYSSLPTYNPKDCDNYINEDAITYTKRESINELSICQENQSYDVRYSHGKIVLSRWLSYFEFITKWLKNVQWFLDE